MMRMTLLSKSERVCLFEEKEICGYIWISERDRTQVSNFKKDAVGVCTCL